MLGSFECKPDNANPLTLYFSTNIRSIESYIVAGVEPPSIGIPPHCTITRKFVIVSVSCWELHPVVYYHAISCCSRISTNGEVVVGGAGSHIEVAVPGIRCAPIACSKVHSQLGSFSCTGQAVEFIQADPEFSVRVSKSGNVLAPVTIEVLSSVLSPLEYDILPSWHVTVH